MSEPLCESSSSPVQASVSDNDLMFITPPFEGVAPVSIYRDYTLGLCLCVHFVGGHPAQLKPCRAAQFLFGEGRLDAIEDEEALFLWKGLVHGFSIVDPDCSANYYCENYDSILEPSAYKEMSALLEQEILDHKVTRVSYKPVCVHSLGAVWKSNGKLRPITDCSRPDGASINNYMSTTFSSFSYNSVQDTVDLLLPGEFMVVVDISSAYRSVNVQANQVCFQGLSWNFGEGNGAEYLLDNRLCFGLRCAPNIFDCLSHFIVKIAAARGATRVVNYLDDFLVIGATPQECLSHREIVTSVIYMLGFEKAWKKVTEPSICNIFLGITIDSVAFEKYRYPWIKLRSWRI